ncbi:MAG: DNA polymerase beta [Gallionellales bacterium RIFCSPLOWO2_02_FULL_57_47]|nr:MAG: DNA polymerase beta [Gallionellales bacterium RIFCSPLOWO2_02_FULL_57_47]
MRLTQQQTRWILQIVLRLTGDDARVFLFGSRLDDDAKGGDVDILIETDRSLTLIDRARIKMNLESGLGLPVDVIAQLNHCAS